MRQDRKWIKAAAVCVAGAAVLGALWKFQGSFERQIQAPSHARIAVSSSLEPSEPPSIGGTADSRGKAGLRTEEAKVFQEFADWLERYEAEPTAGARAALEEEGLRMAKQRREILRELIQSDPALALAWAVPVDYRRGLPPRLAALIEERVEGRGDLDVLCVLEQGEQEARLERVVRLEGRAYRAFVYGARLEHPTRKNLPLHGVALEDLLAVHEQPARTLTGSEVQQPHSTAVCALCQAPAAGQGSAVAVRVGGETRFVCGPDHVVMMNAQLLAEAGQSGAGVDFPVTADADVDGRKRVVIFRVAFANVSTPALSDLAGRQLLTNVNRYLEEVSYGRTTVAPPGEGSAVLLVTLPGQSSSYDDAAGALRDAVRAAATSAGANLSDYDYDITTVGNTPAFSWAGLGFVGAPGSWLANGYFGTGTTVHELGHNFGFPHANYWDTEGQSAVGPGSNDEYGDPFDVMGGGGSATGHYCVKFKNQVGWIPDQDYPLITSSGTYRLFAQDHPEARGLRGLRIARDAGRVFSMEFRQLYTANRWMSAGIGLRWGSGSGSQLIDTTPGTADGKNDAAIVVGRTFTDETAGVHITPIGLGHTHPESLDVVVRFGAFPGNEPPTVRVSTALAQTSPDNALRFTAEAADGDGDALAYFWEFGDAELGENSPSVWHAWTTSGEYVVRCTVSDMKGGTASDSLVVRVGEPSTFSISGRVARDGQPLQGVMVRVNSTRYAYTDSDGSYRITRLAAGNYTVTPVAPPFSFAQPWSSNPVTVGPSAAHINFVALAPAVVVPEDAVWKYLDNGSNQGTAWKEIEFNDAAWPAGPAQLGYGDGDEATIVGYGPSANNKYITTYFRRRFDVADPGRLTDLTLRVLRDDGVVVYLNGTEVLRDNMPTSAISYNTLAVESSEEEVMMNLPISALRSGVNVIAAEVHQAAANSSDLSFALALNAEHRADLVDARLLYLAAPEDGARLSTPYVDLAARALDTAGPFQRIDFFANDVLLGSDFSAPFSWRWLEAGLGEHRLAAIGVDSQGSMITSAPVRIHLVAAPLNQTLVGAGSVWRYLDNGSDQGSAWRELSFGDLSWSSGQARLGYGGDGEATVVSFGPNANNKHVTTYFRRQFDILDPTLYSILRLGVARDDGAIVYLNGVEIFRSQMPAGDVGYRTYASGTSSGSDELLFHAGVVDPGLLLPGPNVIAAEVHQVNATSSDLGFDLLLMGELPAAAAPGIKLLAPVNGAEFQTPTTVALVAAGVPEAGQSIVDVAFYAGNSLIGISTSPPYGVDWTGFVPGLHELVAIARLSGGAQYTSAPVQVNLIAPASSEAMVDFGSTWRYLDTGISPSVEWTAATFDERTWLVGAAPLGYGESGLNTVLSFGPEASNKPITCWFRRSFEVADLRGWEQLRLRVLRDDGVAVYLNGVELFRDNLPAGPIVPASLALANVNGAEESRPVESLHGIGLLRAGLNMLAVEVHQDNPTSSDLRFDLELSGLIGTNIQEGIFLSHPSDGATFFEPASIELRAFAPLPAEIERVSFYADGVRLGETDEFPFVWVWQSPPVGAHELRAEASLNEGGTVPSPAVSVRVQRAQGAVAPVGSVLIDQGATWRYRAQAGEPPAGWAETGFNDSAWPVGAARFGYGLDGERTVLPGIVTAYFRRGFVIANPALLTTLILQLQRDDGAVVYLNGREILRHNMPAGPVSYGTLALAAVSGLDEQYFFEWVLPVAQAGLVAGMNVVAVEVHQNSTTSSDLGFDLKLAGTGSTGRRLLLAAPRAGSVYPGTQPIELVAYASTGQDPHARVEFFADGTRVGEANSAPYGITWDSPSPGAHQLLAVLTSGSGEQVISDPVEVLVGFREVQSALIPTGAQWRFLDTGANAGVAWRELGYNDLSWRLGPAELGYGDGDEATIVSFGGSSSTKHVTTYFRHRFNVPAEARYSGVQLRLVRDDGAIVYLNGTEVFRSNMPAGTVNYLTLASATVNGAAEAEWQAATIDPALLVAGANIVAVEIHQVARNSSDISFNFDLVAHGVEPVPEPPLLFIRLDATGEVVLSWPADASGWTLYNSVDAAAALWLPAGDPVSIINGQRVVRAIPRGQLRFYRLQAE